MDINPVIRQRQLENLEQFITNSGRQLHSILEYFEWTEEKVKEGDTKVTCSNNPNHTVPVETLDAHMDVCTLKKLGYDPQEAQLSEPLNHRTASVYIDNKKKREILSSALRNIHNFRTGWNGLDPDPQTADRLTSTFTGDERLILYNYAKRVTKGPQELPEFTIVHPPTTDRELTHEEILEQERNAKRRRIKYKAVHTSRKNHTEVLRDVIGNQMELYKDWLDEKEPCSNTEKHTTDSHYSYEEARSTSSRNSDRSGNSRDSGRRYGGRKREMSVDSCYKHNKNQPSSSGSGEKRKRDYDDESRKYSHYSSKRNKYT